MNKYYYELIFKDFERLFQPILVVKHQHSRNTIAELDVRIWSHPADASVIISAGHMVSDIEQGKLDEMIKKQESLLKETLG